MTLPVAPQHQLAFAAGARCDICPLHNQHRGPVPPSLPPGASPIDFLVVAEAPGQTEVDEGRTLIGASGREVRAALEAGGLDSRGVSYTNALLCQPPGGNLDNYLKDCKKQGLPSPLECCKPRLHGELARARFKLYVGGAAVRGAEVGDAVMKLRGTPIDNGLATLHPAFVMRDQGKVMRPVFRADVQKAVRLAQGGNTWKPPTFTIASRLTDVFKVVDQMVKEGAQHLAVDTETDGKDPWYCKIRRIGIGTDKHVFIYAPLSVHGHWLMPEGDRERIEKDLADLFARPLPWVFHNFYGFDSIVLAQHGMPVNEANLLDTLIGHHIGITSELPHSLAFLGSMFTDAPYWKDMVKHEKEDD